MVTREFLEDNPSILYVLTSDNPIGNSPRLYGKKGDILEFSLSHGISRALSNGSYGSCGVFMSKHRDFRWVPLSILEPYIEVKSYSPTQVGDLEDDL